LLTNREHHNDEDIITEIEKQYLLDNKDFEDELDEIKHETKMQDNEIRQLKKQKYCVVWPSAAPLSSDSRSSFTNEQLVDKNYLQEEFLSL